MSYCTNVYFIKIVHTINIYTHEWTTKCIFFVKTWLSKEIRKGWNVDFERTTLLSTPIIICLIAKCRSPQPILWLLYNIIVSCSDVTSTTHKSIHWLATSYRIWSANPIVILLWHQILYNIGIYINILYNSSLDWLRIDLKKVTVYIL